MDNIKSIKIGIFSDTHANLHALQAILKAFSDIGVAKIYHCGDMICTGAHPRECVELLFDTPNIHLIRGNHDNDYLINKRTRRVDSHISAEHKDFTFNRLDENIKQQISQMPFVIYSNEFNVRIAYLHYARANERFVPIEHHPTPQIYDEMYSDIDAEILFFGHRHQGEIIVGNKLYIGIGSVGCHPQSTANGIVFTVYSDGTYLITQINVPYDRNAAIKALNDIKVEGTDEIIRNYFDCIRP